MAVSKQAREANGATVHQWNAPAAAVDAKNRTLRGHAQIAPGGQLEPARNRVSFDGRDHRLREEHASRPNGPVAIGAQTSDPLGFPRAHRLEIGAGAEGAMRAGEHGYVYGLIRIKAPEGIGQRLRRGRVDGIGNGGTVDRDDRERAVAVVVNAHRWLSG